MRNFPFGDPLEFMKFVTALITLAAAVVALVSRILS